MSTHDSPVRATRAYQSDEEPERLYALASSYWRFMLLGGAFVCITAVATGAYMLVMTFTAISTNGTSTVAQQNLNRQQLTTVVEGLKGRQTLFDEIANSTSTVADPSR